MVTLLHQLYQRQSKHSHYQRLHPMVATVLGDENVFPPGKLESERQAYFEARLPLAGARVLDIGCNTGYFSFGALAAGASHVTCFEGNPHHAEFVALSAATLGVADRLTVEPRYFDFSAPLSETFDITYCLNVLHHLGDDFGDARLSIAEARNAMIRYLNQLAASTRWLVLQIGFNWKGNPAFPLFEGGEKSALINFIGKGIDTHWAVDDITVPDPVSHFFQPVSSLTLPRNDEIGEFKNRPLFVLRSKVLSL